MTFTVLKSQVGEGFADSVNAYIKALMDHRLTKNQAAPTAPSFIENAIKRVQVKGKPDDFVADFKIIDDSPPPPTPEQKRADLKAKIAHEELSLVTQHTLTPGKWRLFNLQLNDIPSDLSKRTDQDEKLIMEHAGLIEKRKKIQYWAVNQEVALEDTADADLDKWVMTPFKPTW